MNLFIAESVNQFESECVLCPYDGVADDGGINMSARLFSISSLFINIYIYLYAYTC